MSEGLERLKVQRINGGWIDAYQADDVDRTLDHFTLELSRLQALLATGREAMSDRLEEQARTISVMLSDAGIGPCTIPEGVRQVLNQLEAAQAQIASLTEQNIEHARRYETLARQLDRLMVQKLDSADEKLVQENESLKAQLATERRARQQLQAALVGLVGSSDRAELEQMELVMHAVDAPAADKAATIDAIHALLAALSSPAPESQL
jgi:chromosome segregation ATPase